MDTFEYQAEDANGQVVAGRVAAESEDVARRDLAARGYKAIQVFWHSLTDQLHPLPSEEVSSLVDAVGSAAAQRMPIEVTLAALADELNDRRLVSAIQSIAERLRQGVPPGEALKTLQHSLPTNVSGMFQAGLESGDLAGTMECLADQRTIERRMRRKILAAMAYPLLIAVILIPLTLFLCIYIIPMFGDLFTEFDLALPPMTELILHVANQLPTFIVGLLVIGVLVPLVLRMAGGRWLFHRVISALPIIGPIWTWSGQREFAAYLGSLLKLRLPLSSAVAQTGVALNDRSVGSACRMVATRLQEGQTLGDSLNKSIHFDRSLTALVTWGEQNGQLPEALAIAVQLFEDQIDQHASLLRRILPSVTFIGVASIVFFVIVGLMIPLVKLIEGLSQ